MEVKISQILSNINNAKDNKERIRLFEKYSSPGLKAIIGYSFDPAIKWLLPQGTDMGYHPYRGEDASRRLHGEIRRLPIFVDGSLYKNIKQHKREELWRSLLEIIDKDDANMLCYVKDKNLDGLYPNITYDLTKEVFKNGISKEWPKTDPRPLRKVNLAKNIPIEPPTPPKEKKKRNIVLTPELSAKKSAAAKVMWDKKRAETAAQESNIQRALLDGQAD